MQRGGQARSFEVDGLGFTRREYVPELAGAAVEFSGFNINGMPGVVTEAGRSKFYTYNANGSLASVKDSGGRVMLQFEYFLSGHEAGLIKTSSRMNYFSAAESGGVVASDTSIRVATDYTYTVAGSVRTRETRVELVGGSAPFLMASFADSIERDALLRVSSYQYPRCTRVGCIGTDPNRTVSRTYDAGYLKSVATGGGLGYTLAHHGNGQLSEVRFSNGRSDQFGVGPGQMRRISSVTLGKSGAGDAFETLPLGYDGSGNVTQVGASRYSYDSASRIAHSSVPGGAWGAAQSFEYDQYDNMTFATPDSLPADISNNRLLGVSYDSLGRVESVGAGIRFHYDGLSRQSVFVVNPGSEVAPCGSSGAGSCWLSIFGPDGDRIGWFESLPDGADSDTLRDGGYRWTLRDQEGNVVREYSGVNEFMRHARDNVYLGDRLVSSVDASGQSRLYHSDHQGSVRVVSDLATQGVVARRSYSPFGRTASSDGAWSSATGWSGYDVDPSGVLSHTAFRKYVDLWGRFLSPDPARDGWNLYAFARNNPMTLSDPDGLKACRGNKGYESTAKEAVSEAACSAETDVRVYSDFIEVIGVDPLHEFDMKEILDSLRRNGDRHYSDYIARRKADVRLGIALISRGYTPGTAGPYFFEVHEAQSFLDNELRIARFFGWDQERMNRKVSDYLGVTIELENIASGGMDGEALNDFLEEFGGVLVRLKGGSRDPSMRHDPTGLSVSGLRGVAPVALHPLPDQRPVVPGPWDGGRRRGLVEYPWRIPIQRGLHVRRR